MNLQDVNSEVEVNRGRKRIGRGLGSGWGKTAGKGHKGHKSRSGYWRKPGWYDAHGSPHSEARIF
jgi:large subunit ribosomal protein L15